MQENDQNRCASQALLDLGTPVAKFRDVARFSNVAKSNVDRDLLTPDR